MISREQRNRQRLIHIAEACRKVLKYTKEMGRDGFLADEMTQNACIYQMIIMGEAISNIDGEVLEEYDYPWYKVRAFRNYAAHRYFNIEMWTVWEIVERHVPKLLEKVELILEKEF